MTNRVYYLDEDIIETITITAPVKDVVYNYRVLDSTGAVVYIGQVYVIAGSTSVNINVTEVLKMMRPNPTFMIDDVTSPVLSEPHFLSAWRVKLYNGEALLYESDPFTVAMVYRYPNSNIGVTFPRYTDTQARVYLMNYEDFLPVYPFKRSSNFNFIMNTVAGGNVWSEEYFVNSILSDQMTLSANDQLLLTAAGFNTTIFSLDDFFNGATYTEGTKEAVLTAEDYTRTQVGYGVWADNLGATVSEGEALAFLEQDRPYETAQEQLDKILLGIQTLIYSADTEAEASAYYQRASSYFECEVDERTVYTRYPIAKVDICPARFYVQWLDRYGQVMCKPFEGQDDYTESLETVSVQKYVNKERKVYWGVESKWKLRTGWLDDTTYPYYESLFVSPYIILYDSVEDKSYEVLIDDNTYTEKKWENQHQFYNMEINLRHNQKQHIFN